jgi:hypothetical protein
MAVFLSPVGGVAAQFFTNTGAVLTGGKLYTYAAGTTTPATTYTSSGAGTAWTNPIVLDAAGRVSGSGEIWLANGTQYKFVLKDSNDVLIATYDNINGINSDFTNFLANQEIFTATAGQTVFTLANPYTPGANTLSVFVDGVNQYGPGASYAYYETDANTVTFVSGLHVGASVKFTTVQSLTSTQATTAALVTYTQGGTGAVTYTVQSKLRQYVSVKDFGAVGDGTTDDTAAIQAALNAAPSVLLPAGTYKVSAQLNLNANNTLFGDGMYISKIQATAALLNLNVLSANDVSNVEISSLGVYGTVGSLPNTAIFIQNSSNSKVLNNYVQDISHVGVNLNGRDTGTGGCYNCEVAGNIIKNVSGATGWGIGLFKDIHQCNIHDNFILDCGAYGIVVDDGTAGDANPFVCSNNLINSNIIFTTTTNMWGIGIEGSVDCVVQNNYIEIISTYGIDIAEGNSVTVNQSQRNLITGNNIRCKASVVTTGIRMLGGNNNIISDNQISDGDIGVFITIGTLTTMFGNVIRGNSFYNSAAASGTNKTSILVGTSYLNGLSIAGNFVYSSGQYGIYIQGGTNVSVTENKIQNTQKEGIIVTGNGLNNLFITDNQIVNAGLATANTYDAISVTASGSGIAKCIVARNIVADTTGSPTARSAVCMLGTGSVFTNTQIYDNVLAYGGQTYLYLNPDVIYGKSVPRALTSSSNAVTTSYLNDDDLITINLTENTTISAPNQRRDGQTVTFVITQGGSGGYTVAWNASYKTSWVNTGNTVGKVATVTFVVANNLTLTQQSFSGYM